MHRCGTGSVPAVSVLVPVLDRADLPGLRGRVDALDLTLQRTVASYEIVVVLDGLQCRTLDEDRPASVVVRRRARRGGRRIVLLEGVALSSGVVQVVVEGGVRLDAARLRSILAPIKSGADLVTCVDVGASAGRTARSLARLRARALGWLGRPAGLRAFRRHARGAALGGPAWRRAGGRFVSVAV